MREERWLPIIGYENYYEVSDYGRVRSLDRRINGRRLPGIVLKPVTLNKRSDHQAVALCRSGEQQWCSIHRLVLTAFHGPCPEGMECCHNDGNPANNRIDNLRWDTRSSNGLDSVRHGTHAAAAKTHCPAGHPYSEENTRIRPCGRRTCRACHRRIAKKSRDRTRRSIVLAGLGAMLAAATITTGVARADGSPETEYLDALNSVGLVIYDASAALNTGYAICDAFNTATGDVVARNLFLHTTWTDVPDMATANAWVVIAGSTLCPWHFHPERVAKRTRA